MTSSTEERGRRAFLPTLLMGVPASVLALVAATRPMVATPLLDGDRYVELGKVPLAAAVAVVPVLAWGALLLLPGLARRIAALVGLFGSVGTVAAADAGLDEAESALADAVTSLGGDVVVISWTTWFWVLMVASLLGALAFAVAIRHAQLWPGMSRRYDAPGAAPAPAEPSTNQDLWKAIDEGRDPTASKPPSDN